MDPGTAVLLSGAVGSGLSLWGQEKANKDNLKIAREQMAFQERMSNTSWQRARADMEKAGYNPLLAYGQGGASSPSGAGATMESITAGAGTSALDAMRLRKDLQEAQARIDLSNTQKRGVEYDNQLKSLEIPRSMMKSEIYKAAFPWISGLLSRTDKTRQSTISAGKDLLRNLGESGFGSDKAQPGSAKPDVDGEWRFIDTGDYAPWLNK